MDICFKMVIQLNGYSDTMTIYDSDSDTPLTYNEKKKKKRSQKIHFDPYSGSKYISPFSAKTKTRRCYTPEKLTW